ncbi:MAG: hypothetical protein IH861_12445 [Chloroflexi bacterium]|nr:hypothetical protein [Chloroflexota bacterium]
MPRFLADRYLRLSGRGERYFEKHLTVGGLRRLVARFEVHDYTVRIIRNPDIFAVSEDALLRKLPSNGIPEPLLRLAYFALPTYIWILQKP